MPRPSTARRFLNATAAAAFSQGWRVLSTFVATLILRRHIPVDDYGLFSWAWVIFLVLGALRDLGLTYHVLRLEPRPYGNLLLLEGVWGGALVLLTFGSAPWVVAVYPESHPAMVEVLRGLALFMFFEGLSTVPRVFFEGELKVARAVGPELARNFCFVVTAIGLAITGHGVWSLVVGHVLAAALYALLLWIRAWGEIPLVLRRGQTLALVGESWPLALIWGLLVLSHHIDPLILGLRFSFVDIGHYTFAYEWATMASVQILLPAIGRALYPTLVALRSRVDELFHAYALSTRFVLALEVPAALVLFLNAELILRLIGGEQWTAAPTYLRILCFAPLVDPFSRLGGEVLKATNRERQWIVATASTLATFAIGGYVLIGFLGPAGMAWINLLPLGGLVMGRELHRVAPRELVRLVRDLVPIYLLPVPWFVGAWLLAAGRPHWLLGLSLLAAVISVALLGRRYGAELVAFWRSTDPPSP